MTRYLIIGCGHFGSRAVLGLLHKDPLPKITVVDRDPVSLQEISQLPIKTIVGDGQTYLGRLFSAGECPDYIVPAVPYHLAFETLLSVLKPLGAKRWKIPLLQGVPNPMMGERGDLYTSLADFFCPEDCPEPSRSCTVTGKERQNPLFKILRELKGPFDSKVIRSQQLGPGVGGFRPEVVINLIETIKKRRGSNRPFLISTACRCHGVTSALSF
jgi:hypothetical protein